MAFQIGFAAEQPQTKIESTYTTQRQTVVPRKSVVQVRFPDRGMTLAYYNDLFDLRIGDIVFVDGKFEGLRGRVVEVNYNFKIKISEYKRVIAVADTEVHGQFHMAGSHFVTFDSTALPRNKMATWYMAPPKEEDEYASGTDESSFRLDGFKGFKVSNAVAERGHEYYLGNKVVHLCVDGSSGHAIVEGSSPYEIEFSYIDGEISELVCSCFCSYNCKHEVAAMLQLRETLNLIEENYDAEYKASGYFAAVSKPVLFAIAIDGRENGRFTL